MIVACKFIWWFLLFGANGSIFLSTALTINQRFPFGAQYQSPFLKSLLITVTFLIWLITGWLSDCTIDYQEFYFLQRSSILPELLRGPGWVGFRLTLHGVRKHDRLHCPFPPGSKTVF